MIDKHVTAIVSIGLGIVGMAMPYFFAPGQQPAAPVTVLAKADAVKRAYPVGDSFDQLRLHQDFDWPLAPPSSTGTNLFAPPQGKTSSLAADLSPAQPKPQPPQEEYASVVPDRPHHRDVCAADGGWRVDTGRHWHCEYPHRHKHRR